MGKCVPTLDDAKPHQSLAELYEGDHLRISDPSHVNHKDEKLKQEHTLVAQLWNNISTQLNTLSNWHYRPKPPQASINVVMDISTISMEDARPTTGRVSGMLAPQEVYAPGDNGKAGGEFVFKSGASVAKDERLEKKNFGDEDEENGRCGKCQLNFGQVSTARRACMRGSSR
jgi:U3 small nucleolar RNA-associated protein MPP10